VSLGQRSVTSATWNAIASVITTVVLFGRSVLLARMLPVEVFGIYAGAGAIVGLSVVVAHFGLGGAYIHRAPETEDEELAAAVYFTLTLVLTLAWAGLLAAGAWVFSSGQTRIALLMLTLTAGGMQLTGTPRVILTRRILHRRLAFLKMLSAGFTTLVAVVLAWRSVTLWALLATDIVSLALSILLLYVWRPVWRPRLVWSPRIMRYFLSFGSRNLLAAVLLRAQDQLDDLWTRYYLGATQLGFYSRAFTFATYPRHILAQPVNAVAAGTYAELKGQRRRLSEAFFRINALLVRSGFLLGGLLALLAPEFIRLLLGSKWLPMLGAFRLMLVYTLFDPIKSTVANLCIAVGNPTLVVRARFAQLLVLIVGLVTLGSRWGTVGVALAVDAMLVVGITILLWQVRAFVDFSLARLFAAPGLALVLGMLAAVSATHLPGVAGSDWRSGSVKLASFLIVYLVAWMSLEFRQFSQALSYATERVWRRDVPENE
jgi:O-antigen/teichoic acid export membrane protein